MSFCHAPHVIRRLRCLKKNCVSVEIELCASFCDVYQIIFRAVRVRRRPVRMLSQVTKVKCFFRVVCLLSLVSTLILIGFGFYSGLNVSTPQTSKKFRSLNKINNLVLQLTPVAPVSQIKGSTTIQSSQSSRMIFASSWVPPKPEFFLNDELVQFLYNTSKAAISESKKSEVKKDAKERSQEYCNILDHSTYDSGENIPSSLKLTAVAVIVRHGDRTPIYTVPNLKMPKKLSCNFSDITGNQTAGLVLLLKSLIGSLDKKLYSNVLWQNFYSKSHTCALGQLTSRGFLQMIKLGQMLRRTYFGGKHSSRAILNQSSEIYVRTTEYARTIQSAVGFLYGFLHDESFQQVRFDFDKDIYFCGNAVGNFSCNCPSASRLQAKIEQEYKHMADVERTAISQIKKKLGAIFSISAGQIPWLGAVLEIFMSHICHGASLPCHVNNRTKSDCITWPLVNEIWHSNDKLGGQLQHSSSVEWFNRINAFPLLHEIVHRFLNVTRYSTHKHSVRFHFFSGHDKTISALLHSLGINDGHWPPFAAHLVFELYSQRNKQYYIRVLYNSKDMTKKVQFCRNVGTSNLGLCPFDNFVYFIFYETYRYFQVNNYEDLCRQI